MEGHETPGPQVKVQFVGTSLTTRRISRSLAPPPPHLHPSSATKQHNESCLLPAPTKFPISHRSRRNALRT